MKLTSNGYRHTWAWKAVQQLTKKPSEGAHFHSHPLLWTSVQPLKLLNGTNGVSLRIDLSNPHARVHRAFTGSKHCYQCWQWNWSRDQCIMVAQLRTGRSLLAAAYLHRIGHRDSAICPHCQGAEETVEHLMFQCPAHDQAMRNTWPGDNFTTDLQRLWSYLEWTGVVTRPADREWEREKEVWNWADC